MRKGNNSNVFFTSEFELCLDKIQDFFAAQGPEVLEWWYQKEDEIIDYISNLLSSYPYAGIEIKKGPFEGLRQLNYGKGSHRMLNYVIFYVVNKNSIDVINILPSRSERNRIEK